MARLGRIGPESSRSWGVGSKLLDLIGKRTREVTDGGCDVSGGAPRAPYPVLGPNTNNPSPMAKKAKKKAAKKATKKKVVRKAAKKKVTKKKATKRKRR